jgi:cyanophycin synthetase
MLEHGVPSHEIHVIPEETEAIHAALAAAQPGDLVLIFGDAIARSWKQITTFEPAMEIPRSDSPRQKAVLPPPGVAEMTPAMNRELRDRPLIRDERGVRLQRELED